jgi:hypothetical protein
MFYKIDRSGAHAAECLKCHCWIVAGRLRRPARRGRAKRPGEDGRPEQGAGAGLHGSACAEDGRGGDRGLVVQLGQRPRHGDWQRGYSQTSSSLSGQRIRGGGFTADGSATTVSTSSATASRRYCTVNVVMSDGLVSRVNYAGPTGGPLTGGEQCAFAVENCTR